MEDLLTPQISMDIDDTPLDVGKDASDDEAHSENSQLDDDDKVKKLLDFDFKDPSQVPDELTNFEKDAKRNVFSPGELAVQYTRQHCTACNVHLGSAPIGFFDRFIHPLLKVLMCKRCYDFYCSGEFDKDEDGSEMYCRWCGQGGKVMCCAQCAYVFCQKCVRQNLGKKTLEIIKDSDDWMCFGCNPSQLINLKIVCATLYDFTQEEIRLARVLGNVERLKIDHSMCCTKSKPSAKRKRDDDETYTPFTEDGKPIKKIHSKGSKLKSIEAVKLKEPWSISTPKGNGEEVVCAPDVLSLMEEDANDNSKVPSPVVMAANNENKVTPVAQRKPLFTQLAPKPLFICSSGKLPKPMNNFTNIVRIQTPAIKLVSPTNTTSTTIPLLTSVPVQLVPGLKHEWFEKAATVVSTITGNLSFTLDTLTSELKDSKTVENLASIHNKLQELLSTSINSLIQVRKSLRNQFLTDLNNLKFTAERNAANADKNYPSILPKSSADDDDVVIVKSDLPKKEPLRSNGRPYLKVRTVSQLLTVPPECITIPDDPPDPLADAEPLKSVEDSTDGKTENDVVEMQVDNNETASQEIEGTIGTTSNEVENEPEPEKSIEMEVDKSKSIDNSKSTDNSRSTDNSKSIDNSLECNNESAPTVNQENDATNKEIESTSGNNTQENDCNIDDLSEYDNDTSILIRNALTESKLDHIIEENLKCVTGFSDNELRKMLSVRVLAATGSKPDLPENRLQTAEWFTGDIEEQLACAIVPNVNDRSVNKNLDTSDDSRNIEDDEKDNEHDKLDNLEKMDTTDEHIEESCDTTSEDKEDNIPQTPQVAIEAVNDSGPVNIGETLSVNECDLSDDKTNNHDKNDEDNKKSSSDYKETNSENLVSDVEDNKHTKGDSTIEDLNEPIADSGIDVDSK